MFFLPPLISWEMFIRRAQVHVPPYGDGGWRRYAPVLLLRARARVGAGFPVFSFLPSRLCNGGGSMGGSLGLAPVFED